MTDSPFKSGTRVAISIGDRYTAYGYKEDFVEKVHKTGRFTLKSDPKQQWSPSQPWGESQRYWTASQTGDHGWRGGGHLRIWDDAGDADIRAKINNHLLYHRFAKLQTEFHKLRFSDLVTNEVLDQLEIVVLAIKPIAEKAT